MKPTTALLACAAAMLPQTAAFAAGDAATGAKLFLQCRACHKVAAGDPSEIGPNLNGVVGAKVASRADYTYSPALKAKGGVWNAAALDAFLTRPMAAVPGTKMAFGGVANPKARADLIAYLTTLKGPKR